MTTNFQKPMNASDFINLIQKYIESDENIRKLNTLNINPELQKAIAKELQSSGSFNVFIQIAINKSKYHTHLQPLIDNIFGYVKSPPVEPKVIKSIPTSDMANQAASKNTTTEAKDFTATSAKKVKLSSESVKKSLKFKEEVSSSKPAEDSEFSYYKAENPRVSEGGRKLNREDRSKIRPEDPDEVAEYKKSSMFRKKDYAIKTDEKQNWINPFKKTALEHGLTLNELENAGSYLENKDLKFTNQKHQLELKLEDPEISMGYANSLIINDYDSSEPQVTQKESVYTISHLEPYLKINANIKYHDVKRDEELMKWLKNSKDVNVIDAHILPSNKSYKYDVILSVNIGNDSKSLQIKYVLDEKDVKKLSEMNAKNRMYRK